MATIRTILRSRPNVSKCLNGRCRYGLVQGPFMICDRWHGVGFKCEIDCGTSRTAWLTAALGYNSSTLPFTTAQDCKWESSGLVFLSCRANRWKSKHSVCFAHPSNDTKHIAYRVPENADSLRTGQCVTNRRKLIGFFDDNPPRHTAIGRLLFCLRQSVPHTGKWIISASVV